MGSCTPPARDSIELQYVGNYTPPARDSIELQYDPCKQPPTVSTSAATDITATSALGNGNITDDGNDPITQHGVLWKQGADPVDLDGADSYTQEGDATEGQFSSAMQPLTTGKRYYYRAYATNSLGTGYGDAVDFLTHLALSEAVSISASMNKGPAAALPEALALADNTDFQCEFIRSLLESVQLSDGDINNIIFAIQEDLALQDSLHRSLRRLLGDQTALQDAIILHPAKALLEDLPLQAQVDTTLALVRLLQDDTSLSDDQKAGIIRAFVEEVPVMGALAKGISTILSEGVPLTDSMAWTGAFIRAFAETLGLSDGDIQDVVLRLRETIGLGLLIQAINLLDTHLRLDAGWVLDSYYISSEQMHIALVRAVSEILTLASRGTRARDVHLPETLSVVDDVVREIERILKEEYPLGGVADSQVTVAKVLKEALLAQDRLRIGDVWSDPTTRIWVTILNAALKVEVE